jgi:hypothetical protein
VQWGTGASFASGNCTDNQLGNSYTLVQQSDVSNGCRSAIFYCPSVVGSVGTFTITINPDGVGNTYMVAAATEWDTAFEVGATGAQNASVGTAASVGSGTIAAERVLAAAVAVAQSQASITVEVVSPVWTPEFEELSFATDIPGEGNTRVAAASAPFTAAWTLGNLGSWSASIAQFTPAAAQGGGGSGTLAHRRRGVMGRMGFVD